MKTIEDSFDDFFFNLKKNHDVVDYLLNKKSFEVGVEFAQRWISIEDELPEEDKVNDFSVCILVKDMHGKAMSAYYDFKKCGFYSNALSKSELIGITHWRPIELK